MSLPLLIAVVLYLLVTLVLGVWVARNGQPVAEDYFLAGRRLPWYAVGGSLAAVDAGTGYFLPLLGLMGAAYSLGMAPAALDWVAVLAFSLLAWILLPYLYRRRLFTLPELLEARYGPGVRQLVATLTLLVLVLVVLAPAWYLAGRILYEWGLGGGAAGASFGLIGSMAVLAAVTTAICVVGGLGSIAWIGLLQTALLLAGGLALVLMASPQPGGIAEAIRANAADGSARLAVFCPSDHPMLPWSGVAVAWLSISTWCVAGNQLFVQRCLGARSEWDARMGALVGAALRIAVMFVMVTAGLVAFARLGPDQPPHDVAEILVGSLESPIARTMVAVGLIAALLSAAGSALCAAATLWSFDFHQRWIDTAASETRLIAVGRIATLAVALVGALGAGLLAWLGDSSIDYLNELVTVAAPAVGVVLLAAVFWRRAHGRAAAFTLAAGMLFALLLAVLSSSLWSFHTIDFSDPVARRRISNDPVTQQQLSPNEAYQARLLAIMEELARDPVVRRQLSSDVELRAKWAGEPEVQARLWNDPAVWELIAADEQIVARLATDPLLIRHSAVQRLGGWIGFLNPAQVEAAVSVLEQLRSRLNRAAASFGVCLVLLVLSTLIIRQDPGERYDPDVIWTPAHASLPADEQHRNTGPGNLLLWWLALLLLVAGLFVAFG